MKNIYTYNFSNLQYLYFGIIIGLSCLSIGATVCLCKTIRSTKMVVLWKPIVAAVLLIAITIITSVCIFPNLAKMSKWRQALKNDTCSVIEGTTTLIKVEEIYYRDEFSGYKIEFSVNDTLFVDLDQTFNEDVLNAIRAGEVLKIYYYNNAGDKEIVFKIEKVE